MQAIAPIVEEVLEGFNCTIFACVPLLHQTRTSPLCLPHRQGCHQLSQQGCYVCSLDLCCAHPQIPYLFRPRLPCSAAVHVPFPRSNLHCAWSIPAQKDLLIGWLPGRQVRADRYREDVHHGGARRSAWPWAACLSTEEGRNPKRGGAEGGERARRGVPCSLGVETRRSMCRAVCNCMQCCLLGAK